MSRINYCLVVCSIGLVAETTLADSPRYKIVATNHEAVSATITYQTRARNCVVTRWRVYLPEPPELPSQIHVKTTSNPAGKVIAEKSLLARKIRLIDIPVTNPAPASECKVRLDIQAMLRSRQRVRLVEGELPPTVTPLTANEKKYYLAPSSQVDYDAKAFRDWIDAKSLRRLKNESPVVLAARVLEVLRDDFAYRFDALENKRASAVCTRNGTDCGGMSNLFVGAMRINGIPARTLIGRRALPRKADSKPSDLEYDRPHARAEIYENGVGWVPIDPSYAVSTKERPVSDFIGDDPGDLLVLHVDLDLRLPLPDRERTVEFLQIGPYYWVSGRGEFESVPGPNGWEVVTKPIEK